MSIKDLLAKASKYTNPEYQIPEEEPWEPTREEPEPAQTENPFTFHIKWDIPDDTDLQRAIRECCQYMGFPVEIEKAESSPLYFSYQLFYDGDPEKLVRKQNRLSGLVNQPCELEITGNGRICCKVKNPGNNIIRFGDVWKNGDFSGTLPMAIGYNAAGQPVTVDLAKQPHLLISGQTGSGKSILLHNITCSLLMASDCELILVDPKMVEFSYYKSLSRVRMVTETIYAIDLLKELCVEMDARYRKLSSAGCRDIDEYTGKGYHMTRKVVIVDELADLMNMSGQLKKTIETSLQRIGQKARACGIHMILCTQSPRKEVISGIIKANMTTRICMAVGSGTESQIALSEGYTGGKDLKGKGEMLLLGNGNRRPIWVQGGLIEKHEIVNCVEIVSGRW